MDTLYDSASKRKEIKSEHLLWIGLIAFSLIAGISTIMIPPIFMIGLVGVVVSVFLVFRYPYAGVLLYLVIFMVRPAEMYPSLEPLRIERMVGLLVLVATLIRHKREHGNLFFPPDVTSRALYVFLAVMALSWTISYDPPQTQIEIEEFMKLMVFYLLIMYEVNTKLRLNIFIIAFILLVGWIAFLSFRDYYGGGYIVRMGIQRAIGRTSAGGDANTLAGTLATTIPLVVAIYRVYKEWFIRAGCIALMGLLLLMIVNTGSRSGLLTLITIFAVLVYFSKYRLVSMVVALVVMTGGWFLLPSQYKARYETLVDDDRDMDQISSGRVAIWENGLRMIMYRPVLGVGGGGFVAANASGEFGPSIAMQPHNLYIQLFASYGIVGAVVWLTFLVSLIRKLLRKREDADADDEADEETRAKNYWFDVLRQAMFATICGLMVSGMFGHSLMRYTWYLIASMAVSIYAIYYKTTPDTRRKAAGDNAIETEPITTPEATQA